MFEVKNIDIKIGPRYLIKNLSFTLNKGDKLAIIGEEGNGKSTLLKALLGICEYAEVKGTINFKGSSSGYLEQKINEQNLNKKVYDFLFNDDNDYYIKIGNLYKCLESLQLTDNLLTRCVGSLSGGEKVKIGILKLLLDDNDILFLDEPSNDLDIETLEWLEKFIKTTEKPLIFVSHDETLLSKTANMVLHIEQIKHKTECRHTFLKIDYESYVQNRLKMIDKQTQVAKAEKKKYDKHQEKLKQIKSKVEYQLNTISRSDPFGAQLLKKKMANVKAQEKRFAKEELPEIPDIEENINFVFDIGTLPKKKNILKLNIPELRNGDIVLSQDIKIDITGNVHLCITGKNGSGKTTLLKLIYEALKERPDIKVGYMPQLYEEVLDNYDKVLDFISSLEETSKVRAYLGSMKFTRDEMTGKIKDLSNGSKAKLFLIKLVIDKCNVLILDEPTRNVSPLSNPVIRKALKSFPGTIISVSHDRKYIAEVIDELYKLDEMGLSKIENIYK